MTNEATGARVHALDCVRGLAAFSVAGAHYCMTHGFAPYRSEMVSDLAVELFFVLSGFVLAPQILLCSRERRWNITATFLVRRWMRTIPPYIVALTCATMLLQHRLSPDFFRYLFYVQNLFKQHNAFDYFPVAWSLSIEEWFYLVFPITLIACVHSRRHRQILFCCVGFAATIALLRMLFGDAGTWGPSVRRVVVFRIDSIVFGFVLYLGITRESALRRPWMIAPATIAAVVLAYFALDAATAGSAVGGQAFPFLAAAFGAGVVATSSALEPHFGRAGIRHVSTFVGRISYSVYLFHSLLLVLMQALPPMAAASHAALYVTVLVLFCSGFYHFFEKPILEARPRYPLAGRVPTTGVTIS